MDVALRYAARSDVGLVRANNQDSGYAGPHLLVVADGMGGHAGGDVASSLTVAALAPLDDEAHGSDDALEVLADALATAKQEILARTQAEPDLAGMGTTVTAILRSGNKLAMVHLGDSRGYLFRDGALTQVTIDHTFVQHLVDTGRITPEEARTHPQRSVVMRVLGDFDLALAPDLSVREARPGDRWMLCSDGLSGFVSTETIAETLRTEPEPDACAERLVQLALRAGGGDNVTVLVADVVDLDLVPDGSQPSTDPLVVGAAAVDRNRPTSAADHPAARAAALAAAQRGEHEPDLVDDPPPRRRGLGWVWVAVLVLVLGAAAGGYAWTQSQYYVGAHDGHVAVFRGLPATVGPVPLSRVDSTSDVLVDDLPPYLRDRVTATIHVGDRTAADRLITDLDDASLPSSPTTTPSAGPGDTSTSGAIPGDTTGATPVPNDTRLSVPGGGPSASPAGTPFTFAPAPTPVGGP